MAMQLGGRGTRMIITSIDDVQTALAGQGYVCGRPLATVVFPALRLGRPLFLDEIRGGAPV